VARTQDRGIGRYETESITQRGNLRVLAGEIDRLLARRARLQAELEARKDIVFPEELTSRPKGSPVAQIMQEEQLLFDARLSGLKAQVDNLNQIKTLYEKETESLRAKLELEEKQVALIQRELDSVNSLVAKGLTVAPRQLALERVLAQTESGRIEMTTAILRARQEAGRAESNILDLRNKMRNEVLVELQLTQSKLAEAIDKVETTRRLVLEAEVDAPLAEEERSRDETIRPVYFIVRRVGDTARETTVAESELVQPGDVVKVERILPPIRGGTASRQAPTAGAPGLEPPVGARVGRVPSASAETVTK
jgi:polysaccharide biosynthesis/export protein ExoF